MQETDKESMTSTPVIYKKCKYCHIKHNSVKYKRLLESKGNFESDICINCGQVLEENYTETLLNAVDFGGEIIQSVFDRWKAENNKEEYNAILYNKMYIQTAVNYACKIGELSVIQVIENNEEIRNLHKAFIIACECGQIETMKLLKQIANKRTVDDNVYYSDYNFYPVWNYFINAETISYDNYSLEIQSFVKALRLERKNGCKKNNAYDLHEKLYKHVYYQSFH